MSCNKFPDTIKADTTSFVIRDHRYDLAVVCCGFSYYIDKLQEDMTKNTVMYYDGQYYADGYYATASLVETFEEIRNGKSASYISSFADKVIQLFHILNSLDD